MLQCIMSQEEDDEEDLREFQERHANNGFLVAVLEDDVARCEALYNANPRDEFLRRTLVRTIFAEIEGLTAAAIDWARYYAHESSVHAGRYTRAEQLILRGSVTARVNDKGIAEMEREEYLDTKAAFRFALNLTGRGADPLPEIDTSRGGWGAIVSGLKVRNRLMHPKSATDVNVGPEELAEVQRGRAWFVDTYKARQAALSSTLARRVAKEFGDWARELLAKKAAEEANEAEGEG